MKNYSVDIINRDEFDALKAVNKQQDRLLRISFGLTILNIILICGTIAHLVLT